VTKKPLSTFLEKPIGMLIELVNFTLVTLKIKKNPSLKPTKSKKKYMKNIRKKEKKKSTMMVS